MNPMIRTPKQLTPRVPEALKPEAESSSAERRMLELEQRAGLQIRGAWRRFFVSLLGEGQGEQRTDEPTGDEKQAQGDGDKREQ